MLVLAVRCDCDQCSDLTKLTSLNVRLPRLSATTQGFDKKGSTMQRLNVVCLTASDAPSSMRAADRADVYYKPDLARRWDMINL